MLVHELIENLKGYNPNAEVTLVDSETITLSHIVKDTDGNEMDKSNTPVVFIEGVDTCPTCVHEYTDGGERMCSFYGKPCRLVVECYQYEEFDDYL